MTPTRIRARAIEVIEPAVQAAGLELVDLRFTNEQGGWVLRVYVSRPFAGKAAAEVAGEASHEVDISEVDIGDCERMSRELSALLDVTDLIPQGYSLEVSSPGIDRPLRTAAHFARYLGAEIKLTLDRPLRLPAGERRNFRGFIERVEGEGEAAAVVLDVDGQSFSLPIVDVDVAKLAPDWDDVMRGGSGVRRRGPASGPAAGAVRGKAGRKGRAAPVRRTSNPESGAMGSADFHR